MDFKQPYNSIEFRKFLHVNFLTDDFNLVKELKEYSSPRRYYLYLGQDVKIHVPIKFLIDKRRNKEGLKTSPFFKGRLKRD
jgi:hypothetical protein